ncbi:hypothetical protein [Halegenticoccus tardaugens]|uniref:hypothetical protein n=1 Tax=Halegenticoccus tardaugens TaxID=2071624 RepID=UPI00100AA084|nr:hypothetical protein [Halegenticoccus tardaugens]
MTTVSIADTGVFVRCGGPDKDKFQRLRRAVRQAGIALRIPQRVYEELGGDPAADAYPSGNIPYPDGFEEGWIVVADELDYTNPLVSTVMDEARRFIANETDRDEDITEKADTALVGLAAQVLDTGEADQVVLLTTDKPAGRAAETLLPQHGFSDRVEFQYVSVDYLETITANEFR